MIVIDFVFIAAIVFIVAMGFKVLTDKPKTPLKVPSSIVDWALPAEKELEQWWEEKQADKARIAQLEDELDKLVTQLWETETRLETIEKKFSGPVMPLTPPIIPGYWDIDKAQYRAQMVKQQALAAIKQEIEGSSWY